MAARSNESIFRTQPKPDLNRDILTAFKGAVNLLNEDFPGPLAALKGAGRAIQTLINSLAGASTKTIVAVGKGIASTTSALKYLITLPAKVPGEFERAKQAVKAGWISICTAVKEATIGRYQQAKIDKAEAISVGLVKSVVALACRLPERDQRQIIGNFKKFLEQRVSSMEASCPANSPRLDQLAAIRQVNADLQQFQNRLEIYVEQRLPQVEELNLLARRMIEIRRSNDANLQQLFAAA